MTSPTPARNRRSPWVRRLARWWRLSKWRKISGAAGILLLLLAWGAEKYVSNIDDEMALVRQLRGELELHCRHDSILDAQQSLAERVYAIQADLRFRSFDSNLTEAVRAARRDTYQAQHLIELHDQYLSALNKKHDWVEAFPYRKELVSYMADKEERAKKYLSTKRGPREHNAPILTNATTIEQLLHNLRALNARIDKADGDANSREFFGDSEKADWQRKGRELIGTNTLDTMPDAKAIELRSVLQAYLKRTIIRHEEVKNWNRELVTTIKSLIGKEEVALYRNAGFAKFVFWTAVTLFVLGTSLTIVEKWLEPEEPK